MRYLNLSICTLVILFSTFACTQPQESSPKDVQLNTLIDSASYSVGFQNGNQLGRLGFDDVNLDSYLAGFRTGVAQEEKILTDDEMRAMFTEFNQFIKDRIVNENKLEEEEFLAENRNIEGVIETDSGLQYKVIREGDGQKPLAQNKISVMYEGRLIDGTIFDTSYDDGQPSEFILGQVIPGWIEGIQLMNVGSEFEFYIPSSLGYGENPRPGSVIMPGDALIFKVELLDILQ
jgi:FKBP-type peptidyl-prolyl cis-trans isomerase